MWHRYFVSDERQYAYCATPKVACSSWKLALLRLTGNDISGVKHVHDPRETDKFIKRAVHYSVSRRQALFKKYYKFMFVREPLERLVSAYRDKCDHDPDYKWLSRAIRRRRQSTNSHHAGTNMKRLGMLKQVSSRTFGSVSNFGRNLTADCCCLAL